MTTLLKVVLMVVSMNSGIYGMDFSNKEDVNVSIVMAEMFKFLDGYEIEVYEEAVNYYDFEKQFETKEDVAKDFMNSLLSEGHGGVYEVVGKADEDGFQEVVHIYNGNSYWIDERSNLEQGDKVFVLNCEDDLFFQGKINF